MTTNKICITEKGLTIFQRDSTPENIQPKVYNKKVHSLPIIRMHDGTHINHKSLINKANPEKVSQNRKLSELTTELVSMQKPNTYELIVKQEDKYLKSLLKEKFQGTESEKGLHEVIPSLIKRMRNRRIQKDMNFESRLERSRTYIERLLKNFEGQRKFGIRNHLEKKKYEQIGIISK